MHYGLYLTTNSVKTCFTLKKTMNTALALLKTDIADLRSSLTSHPLYQSIQTKEDLQIFMRYHVFAVWDFMSLLKQLQSNLTSVSIPWKPVGNAKTRFLINEIVVGEESDLDQNGNRTSHFELYLEAMKEASAPTNDILKFIEDFNQLSDLPLLIEKYNLNKAVADFISFTFDAIKENKVHILASIFTFGREDLIPDMFLGLVQDLNQRYSGKFNTFIYYLQRHIDIDGDHHSHLALEMVDELCADDAGKWGEAKEFAHRSLVLRKQLWDAVYEEIHSQTYA
jgi:hypothetical protein